MGVYIIAEAGGNHNGNFDLALRLIDEAVNAGADCVKFQTFITDEVVSKSAKKASYQKETTNEEESQYDMVKKLELSYSQYRELQEYCNKKGIVFLSTPFDIKSISLLQELDLPFWKIPSGEITNLPYLLEIAKTGKDVVLSTGMATITEIREAIDVLKNNGAGEISILHCNTEYPTPMEDVNLKVMGSLRELFNLDIGYSDHTLGIEVPIAAVALGAKVIEKHFTLDRTMEGPDHKASLEPHELKKMVESIRNIEMALGHPHKKPTLSEKKNMEVARKSIVARRNIRQGEIFSEENITVKRPGNGISPMYWFDVLGKQASKDFQEDELIDL
ncbi:MULTISPECIES: N-acetylneuraminate synthase [Bacillaceae]|uniref:N-acetylneuraminate synthase n=1 Tax=Evansella alkalicola TaxID=745819 RepID=A0ABS6JYJ5_9BACI|nr:MULTISPECIES: N-acetylneuraminate synthase [Bacillaceae]MBU9723460.1 N-acetylneuraminate synthase [Bacillus alkalicola]